MQEGERYNPFRLFTGSFVPTWLLKRTDITPMAKLCFARLAQYAGETGECFPMQDTLAKEIGCSRRNTQRTLAELIEAGLIESERRGLGKPSRYHFLWREAFVRQDVAFDATPDVHEIRRPMPSDATPDVHPSMKRINEENHLRESRDTVRAILSGYGKEYSSRHGGEIFHCQFAKDTKLVKELLAIDGVTEEEVMKRAVRYLDDTDPFVVKNGYSIGTFFSRWNSYGDSIHNKLKEKRNGTTKTHIRGAGGSTTGDDLGRTLELSERRDALRRERDARTQGMDPHRDRRGGE